MAKCSLAHLLNANSQKGNMAISKGKITGKKTSSSIGGGVTDWPESSSTAAAMQPFGSIPASF